MHLSEKLRLKNTKNINTISTTSVIFFLFPHRLAGGLGWQGPPTFIKKEQAQLDYEGV